MAKQFPRTCKPKAGGTKVSLRYLINCYASPAENAALNNPIAARKNHLEFYTSSFWRVRALIVGQNQLSWPKNLPNTGETQLAPTGEIDEKIAASVTTNHLLLPRQRGKTACLLPIWQPNPNSSGGKWTERTGRGAGGVSRTELPKMLYR